MNRRELIAIYAGGMLGAVARVLVAAAVARRVSSRLPLGTLAVNVSGALLLGVLIGLGPGGHAVLLTGTALLGTYTTFSTWMLETHSLIAGAQRGAAVINIVISLAAGLAAVALGRLIG